MKEEKPKFIGRHLILDVKTSSSRGVREIKAIYDLLESLSEAIDMTLAYPPIVGRFPWANNELENFNKKIKKEGIETETVREMEFLLKERGREMSGISGVAIWIESHAAIHTFPEKDFFSFDAYSCKDFDTEKAMKHVFSFFDIASYEGLDIIRYTDRPQKIIKLGGD